MASPLVRRLGRLLAIGGILVVTIMVAVVALLQLPPVATWAVNRLIALVPLSPGYTLEVEGVRGNWLTNLQLRGVVLSVGRRELARIERLGARYNPLQLRGPDRRLRELALEGAAISASREQRGWDIAGALRASDDSAATMELQPVPMTDAAKAAVEAAGDVPPPTDPVPEPLPASTTPAEPPKPDSQY